MLRYLILLIILYSVNFGADDWVNTLIKDTKELKFSSKANIVYLLNSCEVFIDENETAKKTYKVVLKILREEGIEEFSRIVIPSTSFITLDEIEGWVIKNDGSEKEIEDDQIVEIGIQESAAYFDDSKALVIELENIGIGSVIAYEYTLIEKGETRFFQDFIFQDHQPVLNSSLKIKIPTGRKLLSNGWRIDDLFFKKNHNTYFWKGENLKYEPYEDLTLPSQYLLKHIYCSIIKEYELGDNSNDTNWESVTNWMRKYYNVKANFDESLKKVTENLVDGSFSTEEKIAKVSEYVQNEIRYVALEIGKNRWVPRKPIITFRNKYGDCKDKTELMRAMLASINIDSYPVLVGASKPVLENIPSPFQFNHCVVAIPEKYFENKKKFARAIFNNKIIFDPTSIETKLGDVPIQIIMSGALIGGDKVGEFTYLENDYSTKFEQNFTSDAHIDKNGNLSAKIKIDYYRTYDTGLDYLIRNNLLSKNKEYFKNLFNIDIPNCRIDSVSISNISDIVTINILLNANNYVSKNGNLIIIPSQLLKHSSYEIPNDSTRVFPIWLGNSMKQNFITYWNFSNDISPVTSSFTTKNEIENKSITNSILVEEQKIISKTEIINDGEIIDYLKINGTIDYLKAVQKSNSHTLVLQLK